MPEDAPEKGKNPKLLVPYSPLVKEVSDDGLFPVKKLEVIGEDEKMVTVTVGEKIDNFTPSKIIIQRKGGVTEFATIRGAIGTEETTFRVKRGGKFEIGTQVVESVLDMIGTIERERKPGETDVETELARFRQHLEENKDIVEKAIPEVKKQMIADIPEIVSSNVQLPSNADPLTVLRKLRDEKYKDDVAIDVNDTVETLAEKLAREYVKAKVRFVERMIESRGMTLEEAWEFAQSVEDRPKEMVDEAQENVQTRYKVGDKVTINKGMNPDSEFGVKEPKVVPGSIVQRENETFEVKFRYSDRYIVASTKDKIEFEVTDDMIESKAGEVARPKAVAPATAVATGPVAITTTPPWNALDAKQQQAWKMVVDAISNEGVPPENVISIDLVENRVARDAYYVAVVYEKGGSFYAGPMYGAYGSGPNTSHISSYPNVESAKRFAGSKIVEKTTKANQADRYQAVARYERPPAGYTPASGQGQQTGKTYLRLVLWAPFSTTEKLMADNRKMREHLKDHMNAHLRSHRTATKTVGKGRDKPWKRDFLWQVVDEDTNQQDLKNLESWAVSEGMQSKMEVVSSPGDFVPVLPPKTKTMPAPYVSDTDKKTYAAIVGGALLGGVAGLLLKGEFRDKN